MGIALDATERRIVGTLAEKELSVPETYPLTLNALVAGCNQKSNREPETAYPEYEVQGALRALMERGWAVELEKAGGRTLRYAHKAREQLGVDEHDLALLTELWLRGAQSATELRTRASRMRPFATLEDVERRLEALAARPVPYVRLLGRRPGERVPRWEHLLAAEGSAAPAPVASPAPRAATVRDAGARDPVADLRARLARLEAEVTALRDEMERLHAEPADEPDAT